MWNDRISPCMHDWPHDGGRGDGLRVQVHTNATMLLKGQAGTEPGAHRLSSTAVPLPGPDQPRARTGGLRAGYGSEPKGARPEGVYACYPSPYNTRGIPAATSEACAA